MYAGLGFISDSMAFTVMDFFWVYGLACALRG